MAKKKKSSKTKDPKQEAVKMAMEQIKKEYGKGSIMKLGEKTDIDVDAISTGCLPLDIALGVGGIPRSRISEIYGPEASGKTTLALHIIAEAQKEGGSVAFIDAEHALDPRRAETIGVNLDELLVSQPDTGEQALEIAETLIRSNALDIVVIDSVAALTPRAEIEGEMGDAQVGVQARLMSQAMRKLSGAISKSKTAMIFTNQIRMKIGILFGNPETTPGGKALKFYSSIRIDMRKKGNIKDNQGKVIGSHHRAKVVKNKVAPPFREAEFDIMNVGGISHSSDVLTVGEELEIIERAGSYYRYKDEVIAQGKDAAQEALEEDSKLMKEIEKKIWNKVEEETKPKKKKKKSKKKSS